VKHSDGLRARVRAYVLANPGATPDAIKAAIADGDKRVRNSISALLSADVTDEIMRVELSPGATPRRPLRRYWMIDRGPLTGRRPGRVGRPPQGPQAAPEADEPSRRASQPIEALQHEPEVQAALLAVADEERPAGIACEVRWVVAPSGELELHHVTRGRDIVDYLRRFR